MYVDIGNDEITVYCSFRGTRESWLIFFVPFPRPDIEICTTSFRKNGVLESSRKLGWINKPFKTFPIFNIRQGIMAHFMRMSSKKKQLVDKLRTGGSCWFHGRVRPGADTNSQELLAQEKAERSKHHSSVSEQVAS